MKDIRVLLVDDHTLVRAGIKVLVESLPGCRVDWEADDVESTVAIARDQRPDLILLDVALRSGSGLDALAQIHVGSPDSKVIILSMHATHDFVERALRNGASAYLLKDAATEELAIAVNAVMRGEVYLSPKVSSKLVEKVMEVNRDGGPALRALTQRQLEVLRAIANGRTTKQIAYDLQVSVKTVETHRSQIMDRLGTHDIAGLVRYAVRAGLVDMSD
jgi:DNA-binding NarL/FixJ family response regulator